MESSEKNFTIVDPAELSTIAFVINKPEEGTNFCTLSKLDYSLLDNSNPKKKTFFLDEKYIENNAEIILLSVGKEQAKLNMAVLENGKFYISKKPANVDYKILYSEDNLDYKDIKYTPNFKRPISIIDPEIPDEVRPVLYYDEQANMVKSKIKLQSNKPYIALEIKAD